MGTNVWVDGDMGRNSSHNLSAPIYAITQLPLLTLVSIPLRHREGCNNEQQYYNNNRPIEKTVWDNVG